MIGRKWKKRNNETTKIQISLSQVFYFLQRNIYSAVVVVVVVVVWTKLECHTSVCLCVFISISKFHIFFYPETMKTRKQTHIHKHKHNPVLWMTRKKDGEKSWKQFHNNQKWKFPYIDSNDWSIIMMMLSDHRNDEN